MAQKAVVVQATRQHAGTTYTLLILGTSTVPRTGWAAYTIVTQEAGWTVAVSLAGRGDPVAFHVGLSSEAWRTGAFSPVVDHVTDGVETASLVLVT